MSKRESEYQKELRKQYERDGCVVVKMNPGSDVPMGFPDLLILMPSGRTRLIEMKKPDGVVSPAQQHWCDRFRAMGHDILVVRGQE